MKLVRLQQRFVWQRVCTFVLFLCASFVLFSFTLTRQLADDLWRQLGISQQQGIGKIKNSFINNYLDKSGVQNWKNIAAGDRAAVAKDLLTYAKEYLNSDAFKKEYEEMRSSSKPEMPTISQRTKEDLRKEKIEETEKLIKETEEMIKTATGDVKAAMQTVLEMHQNNLKEYKDPNSALMEMFYQGEVLQNESRLKEYKEDIASWEVSYPADYHQFIKTRLQKYLSIATTVDFSATTAEKYGKQRFVNPSYEAKNSDWKMIYRAGKEVYDVAKPFTEQWLKEIQ